MSAVDRRPARWRPPRLRALIPAILRRRAPRRAPPAPIPYAELKALTVAQLRARVSGEPITAARWVEAAAHHGVKSALIVWGQMLLDGHGTRRDAAAALRWFRIAADAGMDEGTNMVGRCYERGWGVATDRAEAARWFRRAAERRFAWAQFNLAELLFEGIAGTPDLREARHWYLRAARQGHPKAMNMLGRFREEGWLRPPRPEAAARWYRRAAEHGDFRGQFNHARMLAWRGRRDEAVAWLRRSIEGGIPEFCRNVADDLCGSEDSEIRALGMLARQRGGEAVQTRASDSIPPRHRPAR